MADITIKVVNSRRELRKFIAFPNRLFKDVPSYIPALDFDEVNLLTDKNPAMEHCSRELFLAYRGKEVVGRVAAIINRSVNEHWGKRAVRFGWFDFVEDYEVFSALLNKVVEYGKAHGMDEVEGPFGFTDMDKECWAIDNFNARQNTSTLYNPEYYVRYIERAGYEIKCRWQQYSMQANQPVPDKVARLNKLIMEKYKLHLVKVKRRKDIYPHAWKFFHAINESFKDLYDFVPMTEKEIGVYIKEYIPFVNLDFVQFVEDAEGNLVAFGLSIPDLTKAYKKANGKLFPFGWYHILRALHKFDTIDLLLNGVLPEWQKRGVHSIYYSDMNEAAITHGVHTAYTNPQIIGNEAVKIWETQYHTTPLMQRAVFAKKID
ncbi:MAG: hypothetical protein IJU19_06555 [Bacteroidales bacterium]|nr:hypothetical protein [Bacteroidales bacterium]